MGRKRLGKTTVTWNVQPETPEAIAQLAAAVGIVRAGRGQQGALMDAIAQLPEEKRDRLKIFLGSLLTDQ